MPILAQYGDSWRKILPWYRNQVLWLLSMGGLMARWKAATGTVLNLGYSYCATGKGKYWKLFILLTIHIFILPPTRQKQNPKYLLP
jgi:hypothetical protein